MLNVLPSWHSQYTRACNRLSFASWKNLMPTMNMDRSCASSSRNLPSVGSKSYKISLTSVELIFLPDYALVEARLPPHLHMVFAFTFKYLLLWCVIFFCNRARLHFYFWFSILVLLQNRKLSTFLFHQSNKSNNLQPILAFSSPIAWWTSSTDDLPR